jgi:hypothetical protein
MREQDAINTKAARLSLKSGMEISGVTIRRLSLSSNQFGVCLHSVFKMIFPPLHILRDIALQQADRDRLSVRFNPVNRLQAKTSRTKSASRASHSAIF